ncbi:MAG: DUF1553 domain-containing protein [Bryobacterales bacterium]
MTSTAAASTRSGSTRRATSEHDDLQRAHARECTVRRERTNTPLQALVTMNDPQFFEASVRSPTRRCAAAKNFDERLDLMTERLVARPFDEKERSVAREALRDYMRYYDSIPTTPRRRSASASPRPSRARRSSSRPGQCSRISCSTSTRR